MISASISKQTGISEYLKECAKIFEEVLPKAHYKLRTSQLELALDFAQAIQANQSLLAESGTGTGKTFAYLVPALLSGKKVLISTATKTLQTQLFEKDLQNY